MAKNTRNRSAQDSAPQVDSQDELPNDKESTQTETATAAVPLTMDGEAGVDHHVSGADPSTVEKKTVKTSGDFSLHDPYTGSHIDAESEGTEVVVTSFIRARLENGDLEEA